MRRKKWVVQLSEEEKQKLREMLHKGTYNSRVLNRARVLLLAHENRYDEEVAEIVGVTTTTVARWERLQQNARQLTIGQIVDEAMEAVERDNPALDKARLGQLIDLITNIPVGNADARSRDVRGFCKSAMLEEIRKHGYVLAPGRYVGAAPQKDDEPFEEKMRRLVAELREQQAEAARPDAAIAKNPKELGYDH